MSGEKVYQLLAVFLQLVDASDMEKLVTKVLVAGIGLQAGSGVMRSRCGRGRLNTGMTISPCDVRADRGDGLVSVGNRVMVDGSMHTMSSMGPVMGGISQRIDVTLGFQDIQFLAIQSIGAVVADISNLLHQTGVIMREKLQTMRHRVLVGGQMVSMTMNMLRHMLRGLLDCHPRNRHGMGGIAHASIKVADFC